VKDARRGFTTIEVLIAMIILSIGVLALASSAGSTTRMVYNGKARSQASTLSTSVLDSLRYMAKSTTPECTALVNGSNQPSAYPSYSVTWDVTTSTNRSDIIIAVTYPLGRGQVVDSMITSFYCSTT
jgi:type IV pilus modification protein PilV